MGFLQAVYSLGEMVNERNKHSHHADILNFLQLPYPLTDDKNDDKSRKTFVIRIWLDVAEHNEEILDMKGIENIDKIEYQAIGINELEIREKCLYRDPVGRNVQWRYSPLYKLGNKGSKDPITELLGKKDTWEKDKNSRYFKLCQSVLKDFETSAVFTQDSVKRIMEDLVKNTDKIVEFWSDKNNPYFFIFGLGVNGKFLYPGEIPAFVKYFKEKLNPEEKATKKKKTKNNLVRYCSLCGESGEELETLDKVFKFATFDKPGFLPGIKDGPGIREKVSPICRECFATLSAGKEEMENRFANYTVVPGIILFIIPEIISDRQKYLQTAAENTKEFLTKGIRVEERFFRSLARHKEGLVYHFLFAETNQAQLIVHSLIEDVPPTHLRKLEKFWGDACRAFGYVAQTNDDKRLYLDTAIRQLVAVMLSLAGKSDQDKTVMRDKIIAIIGALLNGENINVHEIKMLIVSRLAGLFSDPDWLHPKDKRSMPGRFKMQGMAELVDFMYRVNRREKL
jgi:CRISPR-associated protein Csh1